MNMLTSALSNIGVGDAGIVALLGYAVVFFGLILLMIVVIIIGKAFSAKKVEKKESAPAAAAPVAVPAAPVTPAAPAAPSNLAPGSAGHLKTYDVPPKTCAMLMAIVADKMGKPLNELRFISIKEVK